VKRTGCRGCDQARFATEPVINPEVRNLADRYSQEKLELQRLLLREGGECENLNRDDATN
jgi:hypothetical protein